MRPTPRLSRPRAALALAAGALLLAAAPPALPRAVNPAAAAAELLAADRDFSRRAASLGVVEGLAAMMADDAVMPGPNGRFARGRAEVEAALRGNPANAGARAEWAPVRAGVSADGTHGYTFGFMTVHRGDGTRTPVKYLAYWVRGRDGWRVSAYKRAIRAAGDVSTAELPPLLPAGAAPAADAAARERHAASLREAERSFSRDAQKIGLAEAFRRYAHDEAAHLGTPVDVGFRFGRDSIAAGIAAGGNPRPGEVTWGPDEVRVAPSGDLGVSIGYIDFRPDSATAGAQPGRVPFFTVWKRTANGEWRYVME